MPRQKEINQEVRQLITRLELELGIFTQKEIAVELGIKNTYLSDVINGRVPFSRQLRKKINNLLETAYAKKPVDTLEIPCLTDTGTPVYDIDTASSRLDKDLCGQPVIGHVKLPGINADSIIVTASGNSMSKLIEDKDIIVMREIKDKKKLIYGLVYLIITHEYRLIRYLERHPSNEKILILRGENKKFGEIEISREEIQRIYLIENVLIIKNLV